MRAHSVLLSNGCNVSSKQQHLGPKRGRAGTDVLKTTISIVSHINSRKKHVYSLVPKELISSLMTALGLWDGLFV